MNAITLTAQPRINDNQLLSVVAGFAAVVSTLLSCLICPFAFLSSGSEEHTESDSAVTLSDWNRTLLSASGRTLPSDS